MYGNALSREARGRRILNRKVLSARFHGRGLRRNCYRASPVCEERAMRHALDLWSLRGGVSRIQYFLAGLTLFVVKCGLDMGISHRFGRPWSSLVYLSPRSAPTGHDRRM